jgi:hypothetical protein
MRALLSLGCAIGLLALPLTLPPDGSMPGSGLARAQTANACGCYRDDTGACRCAKKSKCGCPEECEPIGCEEKRQRQAEREANAELKRIAAQEKKKAGEATRQSRKKKPAPPPEPSDPGADAAAEAAKKGL